MSLERAFVRYEDQKFERLKEWTYQTSVAHLSSLCDA